METDPFTLLSSLESISYWGIFGLSLLANMVIPVPEEFFLLALGYIGGAGSINLFFTAPLVITGLFISDMFLFGLSRKGNKYVQILQKKVQNTTLFQDETFVKKHIVKIIVISRFVIQFRFIGPVIAGAMKTPWKKFLFWDFVALCVYVPFVLGLGKYFHTRFSQMIQGVGIVRNIILAIILLFIATWLFKTIKSLFFKHYVFHIPNTPGYQDTWIPGIKKKTITLLEE